MSSIVFVTFVPLAATIAAQQMPDPRQISGVPLPVTDLPAGTIVVRVVRGSISNVIANQAVDLIGMGAARTVKTDGSGHAQFTGLTVGSRVKAATTVDGEKIESQEFSVPASGGIRVMLVATDPESERKAADDRRLAQGPAERGIVVLGEQSRFVIEVGEDGLSVFNLLQILNTARTPVQPEPPPEFDLPEGATGAALLDGSSPQAALKGGRLSVKGPFAPGNTPVQFAYSLPYSGTELTFQQKLPVSTVQVTIVAQKVGDMRLASPQVSGHREATVEGQHYIIAQGPALRAGEVVTFNLSGLPHQPIWPRNLALVIAAIILAAGVWASIRGRRSAALDQARRQSLAANADRLFAELAAIEEQERSGTIEQERYVLRRRELMGALERVYAEMDEDAAA